MNLYINKFEKTILTIIGNILIIFAIIILTIWFFIYIIVIIEYNKVQYNVIYNIVYNAFVNSICIPSILSINNSIEFDIKEKNKKW